MTQKTINAGRVAVRGHTVFVLMLGPNRNGIVSNIDCDDGYISADGEAVGVYVRLADKALKHQSKEAQR